MITATIDTIALGIYWDRLISIADEMMQALIRTAFSSTVRETHDCSTTLFDAQGRAIAQATSAIPSFTGTAPMTLAHMLARYPASTLKPGDILLTNDPWMGTGHMFDVSVMRPIFMQGRLVGYCMSVSHLPDVGGAGWSPETTEMYQEGLRLPVSRFFEAGVRNEWLVDLIAGNVRVSDQVLGDLMANASCTAVAERMFVEFLQEYGINDLTLVADAILASSEASMKASIAQMPRGTWRNSLTIEGKVGPINLACAVTLDGQRITVDYEGSDPAGPWGMNVPMCYTRAMTGYAIKCLTLPSVPNNDGVMVVIDVRAPVNSILNAQPPAATAVRHSVGHALYPLLMGAMAEPLPDRVHAQSGGGNMLNVRGQFKGRKHAQVFFCSGGYGALSGFDGHATTPAPSNPRGMPVEVWEAQTGLFIESKALLPDSGGAGAARGGLGQKLRMRNDSGAPVSISCFSGRTDFGAEGFAGGAAGKLRRYWINEQPVPSKKAYQLQHGDVLMTEEAGGGGFGLPTERPDALLVDDLRAGYVTPKGLVDDWCLAADRVAELLMQAGLPT
ncbi:hydantoinase B/oxoprolinase family protein [Hydrogenophaga sp. OTU3427]|uniref:hydantoinase B/oxoprolinase family protein n=1 Tax=Hydrogenophaga sp. OTU3427 TaxID=3043856 RepID=UPI00313BF307